MSETNSNEQRLDKWLWCARLFKTRSLASAAVKNGRISVNGTRAKASRNIQIGDQITVDRPPFRFELTVLGTTRQRVGANRVIELYRESEASAAARAELAVQIKATRVRDERQYGKLTKKERRERERFKRDH